MTDLCTGTELERTASLSSDPQTDWSRDLVARDGYRFHVRPAAPADEPALAEFFSHVTLDDLRFRFLSGVQKVGHAQLEAMVNVDHRRTENFLAFDIASNTMIATAMLAGDEARASAEVAIAIRADFKHRGISWTLLEHLARFATAKGIRTLESIESRDNHQAIELEREMGFKALPYPGDATLVIVRATLLQPAV